MKHFLLSIGLLLLGAWGPQLARAQAPAWQSARAVATATVAATTSYSEVTAAAVDGAGNVYLAGNFKNTVQWGSISLTSSGINFDVFVAKFSPATNQFVWVQRAGGWGIDKAAALAVSGTSVYVAGSLNSGTADFGTTTLSTDGSNDMFVAKLTDAGSTGSFVWAQRAGGRGSDDKASALAVSGSSVYVAGSFNSGLAVFGQTILAADGPTDVFVAKLLDAGSTGSFAWTLKAGGFGTDEATALAVSGTNVYVAGHFNSVTAGFGATTLTRTGAKNIFVAKLTDAGSTGSFAWAQRAGGLGRDQANAVAVSGTSVYVAGSFDGITADFGPTTLINTRPNLADVFVAKLTDAGSTSSYAWAKQAGGRGADQATALAVTGTSVYVAGYFEDYKTGFGLDTLLTAGNGDVFVAKLADAGSTSSFAWAQRAGGQGTDQATALAVSGSKVCVAGNFNSATAGFGPTNLTNPTPNTAVVVGFLAGLTDPALTATAAGRALAPAQLFPNPARHTVTLRLPAGTAPAPLTLTDAQGRAVRRYPAPAGSEAALDLGGLPAGLYLLRGAGPARRLAVE